MSSYDSAVATIGLVLVSERTFVTWAAGNAQVICCAAQPPYEAAPRGTCRIRATTSSIKHYNQFGTDVVFRMLVYAAA